jgi:hypothetical protein
MIRLYLDEDVHKQVAVALRLRGYDAVSAHHARHLRLPRVTSQDTEVLAGKVGLSRLTAHVIRKCITHDQSAVAERTRKPVKSGF